LTTRVLSLILLGICLLGLAPQTKAVDLPSAKVVSLYESIFDVDVTTLTRVLAETGTQVVFRAVFQWGKENLADPRGVQRIKEIKAAIPGIHLMGGITCANFVDGEYWPNGTIVSADEKLQMLWIAPNGTMLRHFTDPDKAYVLDLSKPLARQFILQNSYTLIDDGFDSLFFDEVSFIPWNSLTRYGLGKSSEEPYLAAWKEISSSVKQYARTTYGKELPVTLNNGNVNAIGENRWSASRYWPYQDFISVGITMQTVETQSIQDDWAGYKVAVAQAYGRVPPTMVFIDWGTPPTSMSLFGKLPVEQQVKMLNMLHETAANEGFMFVYPLHGGIISDHPYVVYDAFKQGTYDTIRHLTSTLAGTYTQTAMATMITEQMTTTMMAHTLGTTPSALLVAAVCVLAVVLAVTLKRRTFK
jgi:hypothetical protein